MCTSVRSAVCLLAAYFVLLALRLVRVRMARGAFKKERRISFQQPEYLHVCQQTRKAGSVHFLHGRALAARVKMLLQHTEAQARRNNARW